MHALVISVGERLGDLITVTRPPVQLAETAFDLLVSQRLGVCP
jgi:hypothetical protein